MASNYLEGARIKKLIARAKKRGAVTYDELNQALPQDQLTSEEIEDLLASINDMGIKIVESETDLIDSPEPTPSAVPRSSNDLILDGTIVRIASIPSPRWFGQRSEKGLASRLYNRLARETATESYVGFLKDTQIKHLNMEASDFRPIPTQSGVVQHAVMDSTMFVITEASYWWAELKLGREFDENLLSFVQTTHRLSGGIEIDLLTPSYDGQALAFKCPSQPQHPSILPDVTKLLEHEWGELSTVEPCAKELEPILSDPVGPTARFRRALNALRAELAAHAILADDDHLNGFSGRQSVADIEPNVDFFVLNTLSPDTDLARLQMDSITRCFDYAVASFDNSADPNATEVEWNDSYEHHRRIGSPEIKLAKESTACSIWYTAATDDRMREAMYTCQRLAPRFGLRVDFDGDVSRAATVFLADDGS